MRNKNTSAIILTGGGARGAYQVGVIKAIAELSENRKNLFPVISGISVGALNAAGLASRADDIDAAVELLETFWRGLRTHEVFDSRVYKILSSAMKLGFIEILSRSNYSPPKSLLDIEPLRIGLGKTIDFDRITALIEAGDLNAVCVTCSGYGSGHAVSYFESSKKIKEWHRSGRNGSRCSLTLEHIMASAALPLLFPAVKIGNEFFGDGALRMTAPLAPAIKLGASRLLVVSTKDKQTNAPEHEEQVDYPSIGDIAGFALDTIFNDSLEQDLEKLERVNKLLKHIPESERSRLSLNQIDALVLTPSVSLKELAIEYASELPRGIKWMMRHQKRTDVDGRLESYLLFEPGYIEALINLGFNDAMNERDRLLEFFN